MTDDKRLSEERTSVLPHIALVNEAQQVARDAVAALTDLATRHAALLAAAEAMLGLYVRLVESGDAGFWNPYTDEEVAALSALIEAEKVQR